MSCSNFQSLFMEEKNKSAQQPLSPDEYIRRQIRRLPLYKCLISTRWDKRAAASIVISRKHANGNITLCFYSVDLYCMGVRGSLFKFNVAQREYDEMIKTINDYVPTKEVDYALVHNVLYASWAYGESLGFEQDKTFLSTTQYMLEKDTDAIPLIEVECGLNGKPCYMQDPSDDDVRTRLIVEHLTKRVGEGNFYFIKAYPHSGNDAARIKT